MKIYGFTLLRNAIKYDYPFQESLQSLAGICDRIYVAVGKGEDETEQLTKKIPKVESIPTIWDENLRESGLILSQQANIALNELRKNHPSGWAIHLQADEVIAAHEYDQILSDFKKAEAEGCDAVSFRYLHFWHSYDRVAFLKRWYSQEIRAIKVEGKAASYGDAQSFTPNSKVYFSDAHIFHYGHVRDAAAYERKKNDFHRWWHNDSEMKQIISKSKKNDRVEPSLFYLGPHPKAMKEKINRQNSPREKLLIYGDKNLYPKRFLEGINVKNILWTLDFKKVMSEQIENVVILQPLTFLENLKTAWKFRSHVPNKMQWREGREWTLEFKAIMLLSEKGFSVDY